MCEIDGLLDCEHRTSDRFAYSAYFAPRRLSLPGGVPLLTRAQRLVLQLKLFEREAAWLVFPQ